MDFSLDSRVNTKIDVTSCNSKFPLVKVLSVAHFLGQKVQVFIQNASFGRLTSVSVMLVHATSSF